MLKLLAAAAVAVCLAVPAYAAVDADASTQTTVSAVDAGLAKMQDQMLAPVIQLNGNCSGSIIYSDRDDKTGDITTYVLTARHCVKGNADKDMAVDVPQYQKMRIVKKDRYIARVKAQDSRADLALLELKDKQTFIAHTATIAPEGSLFVMGEPVWTVGYPLGMALTITGGYFGSIETVDYPRDGVEYFRATPDTAPGNSGGSLFHRDGEGNYELIGVTTAGWRGWPYMTLYTRLADIRNFIGRAAPEVFGNSRAHW